MQFTDIYFAVLLTVVFAVYWLVCRGKTRWQNLLLLAASYLFYGWWDWRFLGLIFLTSATTYLSALKARERYGSALTTLNIVANIAILVCFKYLGFFAENLGRLLSLFGFELDWFTLEVLVPVGISFYTFQAIAYSVDVMKGRVDACRDPLAFFTFICYFPQLVAGPIERASQLLPQIAGERRWDTARATEGMRMIMFGLVKKLCIADMVALTVEKIFAADELSTLMVLAGGVLFSIEIYCDFSAYSEIARGVSRLMGIELMVNFRFPYFSRNIPEFWRRWHISLMEWFRDYIYIPLGGNRRGRGVTVRNILLIFCLSGLWHGSAWNFVLWGLYWGVFSVVARFVLKQQVDKSAITYRDIPAMVATFGVTAFGFYLFRCSGEAQIMSGIKNCWVYIVAFTALWGLMRLLVVWRKVAAITAAVAICACVVMLIYNQVCQPWAILKYWWLMPSVLVAVEEWRGRNGYYPLQKVSSKRWKRLALYWACILFIVISEPTEMTFIYFQF